MGATLAKEIGLVEIHLRDLDRFLGKTATRSTRGGDDGRDLAPFDGQGKGTG